jgi:hypothetical protein
MKTGPDTLGTAENYSECAKHENGTRRTRLRRKRVRARYMKIRPDTLDTAENESGRTRYENGTRRIQHRRKRVRELKT